ncbi:MAG: hypothetical protein JWN80_1474 [Microbacteriaceae bacterium]|nr:hypothetical protein [Microbacteriaceae bacterium]
MFEVLTGAGLAVSAGVNAYIPLLVLGLSARLLDFVTLPAAWRWLENPWVLVILGVLLVIEFVADKIPVVDSVNDWIQTVIRPTAGGIAFGSGSTATTKIVTDPAAFFTNNQWVPIASGVALALAVHLGKAASRPLLNTMTAGIAAPFASLTEDIGSVLTSIAAVLLPILVLVSIAGIIILAIWLGRTLRKRRMAGPEGPAIRM